MTTPILGSHNSMSYLRPRRWWMHLIRIFARCQSKTIQQQVDGGVRCFDLRISFTSGNMAIFSHGLVDFHVPVDFPKCIPNVPHPLIYPVHCVLGVLNTLALDANTPVYVRFILEKINQESDIDSFRKLCAVAEHTYSGLTFIGGVYKKTWQQLYDFHDPIIEADIDQPIGSMASDARWYERIIPILYARRKPAPATIADNIKIILRDFV